MTDWQPIETAPKDGTVIIGASFGRDCMLDRVWWQPEFDGWIAGCREMVMARGYTIDGKARKLHSPELRTPTHWIPVPAEPPPRRPVDEIEFDIAHWSRAVTAIAMQGSAAELVYASDRLRAFTRELAEADNVPIPPQEPSR